MPIPLVDADGVETRLGLIIKGLSFVIALISAILALPLSGLALLGSAMLCGGRCEGQTHTLAVALFLVPLWLFGCVFAGILSFRQPRWKLFVPAVLCSLLVIGSVSPVW